MWGRRTRTDEDFSEEIQANIALEEDRLVSEGMKPEDARTAARRAFGNVTRVQERFYESRRLMWLDDVRRDLTYALRVLIKNPGFTTVAVLTLALGIGANTAIVSLMEAALWKPIPVKDAEQLRLFSWESGPQRVMNGINGNMSQTASGGSTSTSFSHAVFLEFQRRNEVLQSVFAFKPLRRITAVIDGQAELVNGELVSGQFYEGLGVVPMAGRAIGPADDARNATETVAVISDGFWSRRFGRDPSIVGKRIEVNHVPVTIVGVNPREFSGVEPGQNPEIFLPLSHQPAFLVRPGTRIPWLDNPDVWWVLIMGRLKPGLSESQAHAALEVILQQAVRASLPDRNDRDQPHLKMVSGARGLDDLREDFQKPLLVLFSLVGLVLLMACANVANLLLARSAGREREISLRLALGAGRWRVMRQLLTEGLSLAVLGGTAGILLGYWMRDSVPALLATSWRPSPFRAVFDTRVLFISIATTLATGILFSLAPAWRSAGLAISTTIKDTGRVVRAGGRGWRGKPLVVVQVSISVLLLIGAGLFVRTLSNLRSETLGFQPARILLFTLDPSTGRYAEKRKAIFEQLEERIGEIAGVEAVTLSADPLVGQGSSMTKVGSNNEQPGQMSAWKGAVSDDERSALQGLAWVNDVGHRFFETMGIPIIYGRPFGPLDREGSPRVAVVSQQFVRQFFPNENPLGKTFLNGDRLLHIIGVAGDTRFDRVRTPFPPTFYRAYRQEPVGNLGPMTFEVRTAASDGTVVSAIREIVRSIDKDLPVFDVRTQTEQIDATLSQERVFVALTTAFGLLALVLACIGIYGIMANGVLRRTNEIGIRIALGAERPDVVVMILREAFSLAGIGIVIGVLTAAGLTGYIRAMLYGVQPLDPLTISGAIAMMLGITLLAGGIPARRASRLEPMAALRHE